MAEFRNPGRQQPAAQHRRQRQADRGLPRHRRQRRAQLDGQAGRRRDQRQAGGRRARRGDDLSRQRGRRHRPARARTNLSDFLNAPASVARGPFQQHLYRIGAHRDGSKVGVFLFCQQHAREWTTSLSCQETAHELVENYATDPQTKTLLDNIEVFISPNSNPDGAHFSMYDASVAAQDDGQLLPRGRARPTRPRATTWGVDMNRNSGEYSLFDGYFGAGNDCTGETVRRPERVLGAGDPQREVGRGHVPEHQVHEQHPLLRWVLHVGAGLLQGRRFPHHRPGSEHRHRELLLPGR